MTNQPSHLETARRAITTLAQPSLWRWLGLIFVDYLTIAVAMAGIWFLWTRVDSSVKWVGILACLIIIGARQHAIGILGHDGAHGSISKNSKLNDRLTELFSLWLVGIPLQGYRNFHFTHHRTVGTPEDPELTHKLHKWRFFHQWTLPLRVAFLGFVTITDFVGGGVPHLSMAAKIIRKDHPAPKTMYVYTFGLSALCVLVGLWWVPIVWLFCLGTTFWAAFRLRMWTEHIVEKGSDFPTQRVTGPLLLRFFIIPHNTWYHWEHHSVWDNLHLHVPCWNLPQAREILKDNGPPIVSLRQLFSNLRHTSASNGTMYS